MSEWSCKAGHACRTYGLHTHRLVASHGLFVGNKIHGRHVLQTQYKNNEVKVKFELIISDGWWCCVLAFNMCDLLLCCLCHSMFGCVSQLWLRLTSPFGSISI